MNRIIRLEAENIKRLQAVQIEPDGNLVVIGGDNGQGKSSVLDSIMYALAGGKTIPAVPLRKGAKKGRITVDLGDMVVERVFTEKSSRLEIRSKEGHIIPSPQAVLDKMCGRIAFDPLQFSLQSPKEQVESLRQLVGLDFSALDRERQQVYDQRTDVNRQAKQKAAELAACAFTTGVAESETSVAELAERMNAVQQQNIANARARDELQELADTLETRQSQRRELSQQIAALEKRLVAIDQEIADRQTDIEAMGPRVAALVDGDTAELSQQIRSAESVNAAVRQNARHRQLASQLADLESQSKALTDRITAIDQAKTNAIETADLPYPGLGFGDDGVTYQGLPLEQAMESDRTIISAAIGRALNPQLPVVLIRNGSAIGPAKLAALAKWADEDGAQVWLERVSVGEEVSVVIEDGRVRADEPARELAATD